MVGVVIAQMGNRRISIKDDEGRGLGEFFGVDIKESHKLSQNPGKVIKMLYDRGYELKGGGCGFGFYPWAKSVERDWERDCVFIFVKK